MAVFSPLVLAEQCGRDALLGEMRFITEKIDFLISPALAAADDDFFGA